MCGPEALVETQWPQCIICNRPPNYHVPFNILVSSYVAEGLVNSLRHHGPGLTATSALPTPLVQTLLLPILWKNEKHGGDSIYQNTIECTYG